MGRGRGGSTPIRNKQEECLLRDYGNYHVPGKTNVKTVFDFEDHRRAKQVRGDHQSKTPNFSHDKALKLEPLQSERDQFVTFV